MLVTASVAEVNAVRTAQRTVGINLCQSSHHVISVGQGIGFAKDDFRFVGGKRSGGIAVFGRIALSAAA
jgi:hypothetical protein